MISLGNKFCLFRTEEGSANLNFPSPSALRQRSREMMSCNDALSIIPLVFKSGDITLDSHSEGNHLPGALFYVLFGQKPVRNSKPYIIAAVMLGSFGKYTRTREASCPNLQLQAKFPASSRSTCTCGGWSRGKGLTSTLAFW
jgi:hypothetical protein